MLITEFRELVVKEHPCESGLEWLDDWIAKHPKGTTSQFFKAKRNVSRSGLAYTPNGYLVWLFCHLLDWSKEQDGIEVYEHFYKSQTMCQKLLDSYEPWSAKPSKLADALSRAYE